MQYLNNGSDISSTTLSDLVVPSRPNKHPSRKIQAKDQYSSRTTHRCNLLSHAFPAWPPYYPDLPCELHLMVVIAERNTGRFHYLTRLVKNLADESGFLGATGTRLPAGSSTSRLVWHGHQPSSSNTRRSGSDWPSCTHVPEDSRGNW